MTDPNMSVEELILTAAEFVGRGLEIPRYIKGELPQEVIWDIENPEIPNNGIKEP